MKAGSYTVALARRGRTQSSDPSYLGLREDRNEHKDCAGRNRALRTHLWSKGWPQQKSEKGIRTDYSLVLLHLCLLRGFCAPQEHDRAAKFELMEVQSCPIRLEKRSPAVGSLQRSARVWWQRMLPRHCSKIRRHTNRTSLSLIHPATNHHAPSLSLATWPSTTYSLLSPRSKNT